MDQIIEDNDITSSDCPNYPEEIVSNDNELTLPMPNTNKENMMEIKEMVDLFTDIRIITNEELTIEQNNPNRDVVKQGDNYRWAYLGYLNKLGYTFRVVSSPLKTNDYVNGRHTRTTTLAYPDAGTGTWVQIRIWDTKGNLMEWGNLPFITLANSRKMPKRLKELTRKAQFVGFRQVSMRKISADQVENITDMDGMNFIRRSVAAGLANTYELRRKVETGEMVRFSFRALTGAGLLKGDAIAVDDDMIDHDIITFDDNVKDEVRFNGGSKVLITMEPHHAYSQPWTNVQRFSHLGQWLYGDGKALRIALNNLVEDHFEALNKGIIPGWMKNSDATTGLASKVTKWIKSGRTMTESIYLTDMVANSIVKQLSKKRASGEPENRFPIPWAVTAHVVTHEALIEGGYEIDANAPVIYHAESQSISFPGEWFAKFFERHGTWDLDETLTVHMRWTESGHLVGIGVRDPNSYGEYSVFPVEADTFPWQNTRQYIPRVSMKNKPTYIDKLPQRLTGLEGFDRYRPVRYSPLDAEYFGMGLTETPGVGALVNVLMAYWDTYDQAPNRAPAQLGDMVDILQQEPDHMKLEGINNYILQLLHFMHSDGQSFDEFLFTHRLSPAFKRNNLSIEDIVIHKGSHTKRDEWYGEYTNKVAADVAAWVKANVEPIESLVTYWDANFTDADLALPKKMVNYGNETYQQSRTMDSADLRRRYIVARNTTAVNTVVRKMENNTELAIKQVVGAYIYCMRHGRPDHLFFGDSNGSVDMMDLFLTIIGEVESRDQ